MKIGIVGGGRIGPGLGSLWAQMGHRVVLGDCQDQPRSAPEAPVAIEKARPRAAADADVVLLAVAPEDLEAYLDAVGPLAGRVVITPSDAHEAAPNGMPLVAWLEQRLPEAHIVRAFENVAWSFGGWDGRPGAAEIPVSAGDDHAFSLVSRLVQDLALVPSEASAHAYWPTVYLEAVSA